MEATSSRPEAAETTELFVYGTLKLGQSNHWRLEGAHCLGAVTLEGAHLYDLGPFPMAVAGEGSIEGELYAISWPHLSAIDAFEGCPRLYERRRLPLADGRQAWVYLGRPRQVRHVKRIPRGSNRAATWAQPFALLLLMVLPLGARSGGFDTLGTCQAWRSSHGIARIELANAIGAAHYLTKRHPFQESSAQAPVDLYSPADIQRVCGR
jgi:gamma-glutamylcyclotransferase (GGCT)/AIG2-like uncharacterized protein YtfP